MKTMKTMKFVKNETSNRDYQVFTFPFGNKQISIHF